MNYAYSTDEEHYSGSFASPEDAAAEAFSGDGDLEAVFVGEMTAPVCAEHINAKLLFDHIAQQDEYANDDEGDTFKSVTKEAADELTGSLQKLFNEWMDKWTQRPSFFMVKNPKEWARAEAEAAGLLDSRTEEQ